MKVCINGQGHMTKMAAMAINSKRKIKIFFSRTRRPMILKLGMKHQTIELYKVRLNHGSILTNLGMKHWGLKYYNMFINHDPVMTLTYFMARST